MIVRRLKISPHHSIAQTFFKDMLEFQHKEQVSLYLVGGFVRDLILGEQIAESDCDFIVERDVFKVADSAANRFGGVVTRHPAFLTAKLTGLSGYQGISEIDFAQARTEQYRSSGALPEVTAGSLVQDIHRRDFTINALLLKLDNYETVVTQSQVGAVTDEHFIDQVNGFADIQARVIRILHQKSFIDDPTRIFRGVRYQVRLRGSFAPATLELLRSASQLKVLSNISPHRKWREIEKIVAEPGFIDSLATLNTLGLLSQVEGFEQLDISELIVVLERAKQPLLASSAINRLSSLLLIIERMGSEGIFEWPTLSKKHRKALKKISQGQSAGLSDLEQLWQQIISQF